MLGAFMMSHNRIRHNNLYKVIFKVTPGSSDKAQNDNRKTKYLVGSILYIKVT